MKDIIILLLCLICVLEILIGRTKPATRIGCDRVQPELEMRDYQFDIYMDTVWVYDQNRYVGRYTITEQSARIGMDSVIINDNQ